MISETTPEEIEQLQALGRELAGAIQSEWQPRTIARAFASPVAGTVMLTMQRWIDLDVIKSPLLQDRLPEDFGQLDAAAVIFGLSFDGMESDECLDVANGLLRAVRRAFSAALKMVQPNVPPAENEADGFGDWAPLLAFLIAECGLGLGEALAASVEQAFILLATVRRNQGWQVAGKPYALRDVEEVAHA